MTTVDLAAMEATAPGRVAWATSTADLPPHADAQLEATFTWRDPSGADLVGRGRVWLPVGLDGTAPLLFIAGYEAGAAGADPWLAAGFVVSTVVTPEPDSVTPGTNPISRGVNLDATFLHAVRLAPFVDDARVFISGGSAGGYMTLMLAAESFPIAGAMPEVPVVNLGYNTAFWLAYRQMSSIPRADGTVAMPYLSMLQALGDEGVRFYGADTDAEVYLTHSPVGHLDRITCPVSVCFTTADNLVPIEQVSSSIAGPLLEGITTGMVMSADVLCADGPGRVRLLDTLDPALVDLTTIPVPDTVERRKLEDLESLGRAHVLALPAGERRWQVAIIDEGGPDEDVPHYRYNVAPTHEAFWRARLQAPLGLDQLDETKLRLLIDRWSGREWMVGGPPQLDVADAERADVARGLRTWCAQSPEHAERLRELYAALPAELQVLPAEVLQA